MIEAALHELPIDPNQCAVVGDTEHDVGLARNSLLPCDWITASEPPVPAHVTRIEHHREVIDHWQDTLGQRPPGH